MRDPRFVASRSWPPRYSGIGGASAKEHGIEHAIAAGMTEREPSSSPIDESTYGGSSSETGGLYNEDGPTIANPEGDTMAEEDEADDKWQNEPTA
jgi:hypothetical protein